MALDTTKNKLSRNGNIQPPEWKTPSWDPDHVSDSLQQLYDYAEQHAKSAIDWYYHRKRGKARFSQFLRTLTILSTGIAGLIPVIAIIGVLPTRSEIQELRIHEIGYLCLILAAFFLGVDRYSGSSTGWMRYIATAMSLETALEHFRFDWARITASLNGKVPDGTTLESLIERITEFSVTVRTLVEKETQAWVTEFQSNLSQLEKETRAALDDARAKVETLQKEAQTKRQSVAPGAIDLTIENFAGLDHGYSVTIDDKLLDQNVLSKTHNVLKISPGLHSLVVDGTIGGFPARGTKVVTVQAGAASAVTVELTRTKAAKV